jgi:cytosine/adenosine deaminase-related metal-dependent hydrolase
MLRMSLGPASQKTVRHALASSCPPSQVLRPRHGSHRATCFLAEFQDLPCVVTSVFVSLSRGPQVTLELMISSARLARKYPGVRLHTHLAENQVGFQRLRHGR